MTQCVIEKGGEEKKEGKRREIRGRRGRVKVLVYSATRRSEVQEYVHSVCCVVGVRRSAVDREAVRAASGRKGRG